MEENMSSDTAITTTQTINDAVAETVSTASQVAGDAVNAVNGLMQTSEPAEQGQRIQDLVAIGESTVYLMGMSFIIGSLFTILILLVFDFMRRNAKK